MSKTSPPWIVEWSRKLHGNPWFNVLEQRVLVEDQPAKKYFTIDFPRPSVGIVARRDNDYLLIRQYRFIVDEYVWAIPSGGVEIGETAEMAAKRELIEETGFDAPHFEPLLDYYPSYGATNQRFMLFLADNIFDSGSDFDRGETLEINWFSRTDIIDMILENRIVDGLSLAPLATLLLREEVRGHKAEVAE